MERRFLIPAGHPIVGRACSRCGATIVAGDECYLDPEAPASFDDARKRDAGQSYTAISSPAHWACHPNKGREVDS